MRHDIHVEGAGFRLRPVADFDAPLISALRSDSELGRFLHPTPPALSQQLAWLAAYYEQPGDYYFVVERIVDGLAEGVIALYSLDEIHQEAEWGRWVLKRGSLAAVESAALIYRCAFHHLALAEVYCRTVADNTRVVAFHDSCGCAERHVLLNHFELGGRSFDAVEHRVNRDNWCEVVGPHLERLAAKLATRISNV
ncbi:GNAT family N-acetyltransferase [Castellaniella defragrans]|uniref:GNAT family N-acetyltransferase n=1 Tax=Castellaniella defragrans TaxID=75697 RepID=UPI002B001445|nr:GNAT family N-acetyltransferase [Castellaniella defragrans]